MRFRENRSRHDSSRSYELAAFVTTLATFDQPVAEYGYTVGLDGTTIASVEAGLPAAKAGIEAGDRIPFANALGARTSQLAFRSVRRARHHDAIHRRSSGSCPHGHAACRRAAFGICADQHRVRGRGTRARRGKLGARHTASEPLDVGIRAHRAADIGARRAHPVGT